MKKKIFIGSIIAVALLILVSFSSVVGYSSVKSDSRIASPLFGIRTNRAINKEQDAVTSDYIGKGKAINIPLPKRNDNVNLMYRMIDFISKANDRTFDRFLDLVCSRLSNEEGFTNKEIDEIIEQCRYIRQYPDEVESVVANDNTRKYATLNIIATIFILILILPAIVFIGVFIWLQTMFVTPAC